YYQSLSGYVVSMSYVDETGNSNNRLAYRRFIAPALDARSRRYWESRDWLGRRRVNAFERNFYHKGLLGLFIGSGHLLARLHGADPADILQTRTLREQRHFFEERLAPIFNKPLLRWLTARKSSLFGLGIPPARYDSLLT